MNNFLQHAKGLTRNPLGIIALFVSLIYGFACLVLSTSISNLHDNCERLPLIWFIIVFPIIILVAFIFLVTKHHGKLYSPSDYGSADSFLKTIEGAKKFEPVQIEASEAIQEGDSNSLVRKAEDMNFNKGLFSAETTDNLSLGNEFFKILSSEVKNKRYWGKIKNFSFGAQAPEYFIFRVNFDKQYIKQPSLNTDFEIIIRITKDNSGILNMIAIGKDIIETDPSRFTNKILEYIDKIALGILKEG